jgi:hypothetical protein
MGAGLMLAALLTMQSMGQSASAGPQQLALTPSTDSRRLCTDGAQLCFAVGPHQDPNNAPWGPTINLWIGGEMGIGGPVSHLIPIPLRIVGDDIELLPQIIRLPGNPEDAEGNYSIIVGVITQQRTSYSGGGGSAQRLHLYRVRMGVGAPRLDESELLSVPWQSSLMIRACFAEADTERRRGACHDEYGFGATITLAANEADDELPPLRYQTQATAYPQTARRGEDSSTAAPLRESDLTRWRDPECSYARTLRFNPATERYEMDRPAPDCSTYTVP